MSKCFQCAHEYTLDTDIFEPELYGTDYYEITHRRWFANPQISLFKKIATGLLQLNTSIFDGSDTRILDIGCGRCSLLSYLASVFRHSSFVGIDTSVNHVTGLDSRISLIDSVFSPQALQGKFDIVLSTAVIEHVFDVRQFLADQISLLKDSRLSLLVVVTMDSNSPIYVLARLLRQFGFSLAYDRLFSAHHVNHFSRESLHRLCKSLDLEIVKEDGVNIELAALDLPSSRFIPRSFLELLTSWIFCFGTLVRRPFLQILFLRPRT